jgi:hypothetical protein
MNWHDKKTKEETPRHQDAKGADKRLIHGFNLVSWRLGVSNYGFPLARE